MRDFKLTVAYDGTGFHGWQRQPGQRTVQGELEGALSSLLEEEVTVSGAGRTDAGVHARGQVASFHSDTRLPVEALVPALNQRLPEDLRAREARAAAAGFDARRSALSRSYRYRLLREDDVLFARIAWRPRQRIEREALERAVEGLVGGRDFRSLEAAGSTPTSTVCRVLSVEWVEWEGGVALDVTADHFLYRMVRNLVGTALAAAAGPDPARAMEAVLEARDRRRAGVTAPAHGLSLERVSYPKEVET